jgi:hypothetical protein
LIQVSNEKLKLGFLSLDLGPFAPIAAQDQKKKADTDKVDEEVGVHGWIYFLIQFRTGKVVNHAGAVRPGAAQKASCTTGISFGRAPTSPAGGKSVRRGEAHP